MLGVGRDIETIYDVPVEKHHVGTKLLNERENERYRLLVVKRYVEIRHDHTPLNNSILFVCHVLGLRVSWFSIRSLLA